MLGYIFVQDEYIGHQGLDLELTSAFFITIAIHVLTSLVEENILVMGKNWNIMNGFLIAMLINLKQINITF